MSLVILPKRRTTVVPAATIFGSSPQNTPVQSGAPQCAPGRCRAHGPDPLERRIQEITMIRFTRFTPAIALALFAGAAFADSPPIFVNVSATGANTGASWPDAYTSLQTALDNAPPVADIWVAQGTYYPTAGDMFGVTFRLRTGLAIYGGFAGTESSINQRDPSAHITILSGDIGRNDPVTYTDNAHHVITDELGSDSTAILDGFTVRAGGGVFYPTQPKVGGGGFWLSGSHALIRNCVISNRFIAGGSGSFEAGPGADGAGAYISGGAPSFINCTFTDNAAGAGVYAGCRSGSPYPGDPYGGSGGAIYSTGASPSFTACRFLNNSAGNGGQSAVCLFSGVGGGNGGYGGAVYAASGTLSFTDCLFQNNVAGAGGSGGSTSAGSLLAGNPGIGGAIAASGSEITLTRCTFDNNRTFDGRGGGCTAFGPPVGGGGSGGHGAAVALLSTTTTIDGCRFFTNRTGNGGRAASCNTGLAGGGNGGSGPAIYVQGGTVLAASCAFSGNRTGAGGPSSTGPAGTAPAGVPGVDTAQGAVINGTFVANANALGVNLDLGHYSNTNSIIWTPLDPSTPTDPRFVDADGPDNILGTLDDDFRLTTASPYIDAGDNALMPALFTLDAAAHPRFIDIALVPDTGIGQPPIIDLGAYETQNCPADFNGSGLVSVQDIFDFLTAYFSLDPRADFNGQGGISVQDIFDFLAAYFAACP
jgi:hypothetical protein